MIFMSSPQKITIEFWRQKKKVNLNFVAYLRIEKKMGLFLWHALYKQKFYFMKTGLRFYWLRFYGWSWIFKCIIFFIFVCKFRDLQSWTCIMWHAVYVGDEKWNIESMVLLLPAVIIYTYAYVFICISRKYLCSVQCFFPWTYTKYASVWKWHGEIVVAFASLFRITLKCFRNMAKHFLD